MDDAGRLKITDRKKDLVKTSGGKYIAPGQIAAQIQGDLGAGVEPRRHANNHNFASALVSLDPDALTKLASSTTCRASYAALSQAPEVRAQIQSDIDKLNEHGLNRWETVGRFTILEPRPVRRRTADSPRASRSSARWSRTTFADLLDAMYA